LVGETSGRGKKNSGQLKVADDGVGVTKLFPAVTLGEELLKNWMSLTS